MTDAIQTARELATHASDIAHLQSDMDRLVDSVNKMQETLNGIERTLAEAKGGWRVLVAVGGAAGVLGGLIVHFANWWNK
jgi:prefoldin subunit 5